MKKSVFLLCAGLLALNLTACGKDGQESGGSQSTEQTQEEGTQGSQSEAGTEESSETSESETPEVGGATSGHDYETGWTEEMKGLKEAVAESLGEDYWPDMQMLPDMLEMSFGITADMYEDYMAESPMISTNVDTLLIVKAKEGKLEAVQQAVTAYREAQIGDTMQYPMNVGKVQASRIETIGNYVIFAQLGADTTAAMEEGDEAVVDKCQKANDQVIEVIRGQLENTAG